MLPQQQMGIRIIYMGKCKILLWYMCHRYFDVRRPVLEDNTFWQVTRISSVHIFYTKLLKHGKCAGLYRKEYLLFLSLSYSFSTVVFFTRIVYEFFMFRYRWDSLFVCTGSCIHLLFFFLDGRSSENRFFILCKQITAVIFLSYLIKQCW